MTFFYFLNLFHKIFENKCLLILFSMFHFEFLIYNKTNEEN